MLEEHLDLAAMQIADLEEVRRRRALAVEQRAQVHADELQRERGHLHLDHPPRMDARGRLHHAAVDEWEPRQPAHAASVLLRGEQHVRVRRGVAGLQDRLPLRVDLLQAEHVRVGTAHGIGGLDVVRALELDVVRRDVEVRLARRGLARIARGLAAGCGQRRQNERAAPRSKHRCRMRLAHTNATPGGRRPEYGPAVMAGPTDPELVALGRASAELAHELRNVLATIGVSAHAAARNPADAARFLARIGKHAELGQRLVEDVLLLSRDVPVEREVAATVDVLAAARATLEVDATFVDEIAVPMLSVHAALFPRVLHALYANAAAVAKAEARTATVVTRVLAQNDAIVIDVEDDGPGVPESLRDRLFEPFATAREGGTGLGLALARRITEAHGGRLTLQSGRASTTFRIALPTR